MKQLQKPLELFVMGPFLVYIGINKKDIPFYFRAGLALAGAYTIYKGLEK